MTTTGEFVNDLCTRISQRAAVAVKARIAHAQNQCAEKLYQEWLVFLSWYFLAVVLVLLVIVTRVPALAGPGLHAFVGSLGALVLWALCGRRVCTFWCRLSAGKTKNTKKPRH